MPQKEYPEYNNNVVSYSYYSNHPATEGLNSYVATYVAKYVHNTYIL